eukprot:TRINITY_DN91026_c0_g1_i1.p1 TRINITY_DN91026_c0_g1~~TRINITY_DN91026_c0_g1_i1.p1  ORF type:complete len:898 (-),score=120.32 TRINITY_DN91026_c0_g1_i1:30-2375(-)
MFFVDTAGHQSELSDDGRGRKNVGEAAAIAEHIEIFVSEGVEPAKITVLCMYNGQRMHIPRLLERRALGSIQISTIDQFQGDENDVVLVSLTRGEGRFVNTRNRRCVAVSRARSCLVLYGNATSLRSSAAWGPPLQALESQGLLSKDLPLQCPRHPGVWLGIGGKRCERRCEARLACSHTCGRTCHFQCPPCEEPVDDEFPECKHQICRPCGTPLAGMLCRKVVAFERPCGHPGKRECHEVAPPCVQQVDITCNDCGRLGSTTCSVAVERPGDYSCPHPCVRRMRCGHPCTLKCGEPCDNGLASCSVCAVEREQATAERMQLIQDEIEKLDQDDYFRLLDTSDIELDEIKHLCKSFCSGSGAKVSVLFAKTVHNTKLRRQFLLSSQRCFAPKEPCLRILIVPPHSDVISMARDGVIISEGSFVEFSRVASGLESTEREFLVCRVQFGREHECGKTTGADVKTPPDGFDCIYDLDAQCHRIFAGSRILPLYHVHAQIKQEVGSVQIPSHWQADDMPAQGWRCIRLEPDSCDFQALARSLRTDPAQLGVGRDVQEHGKYRRLVLARAWRIENPRLWRRYATERQSIQEEINTRSIRLPKAKVRTELSEALKQLPEKLLSEVNEVRLLHGTAPETVLTLLSNGPNERFSGGLFGSGTYLAEDAGKNDQYVKCDCHQGQVRDLHRRLYSDGSNGAHPGSVYYLLLCRTILGRFVRTQSGRPSAKAMGTEDECVFATSERRELAYIPGLSPPVHYHALVAEVGGDIHRFREFVQFRDARIYPECSP